jgi:hypothetical protein
VLRGRFAWELKQNRRISSVVEDSLRDSFNSHKSITKNNPTKFGNPNERGLFGKEGFDHPRAFDELREKATKTIIQDYHRIDQIRSKESFSHDDAQELLLYYDQISENLCSVLDTANLCGKVFGENHEWVKSSTKVGKLSFIHQIFARIH